MRRRKYTTIEALKLMKKGKLMAMGEGHIYPSGYYYNYVNYNFIGHNGDGSINKEKVDFTDMLLERPKKFWVVVTKNDLINLYKQGN